jgi:hypothetical protein
VASSPGKTGRTVPRRTGVGANVEVLVPLVRSIVWPRHFPAVDLEHAGAAPADAAHVVEGERTGSETVVFEVELQRVLARRERLRTLPADAPQIEEVPQKIDYKKSDAQNGVMTLYDIPAQTMFFTDRPNRVVGNVPTSAFVSKWTTDRGPGGFASNPRNAAVTVFQSDGAKSAIVELRNPRLDGNKTFLRRACLAGH